MNFFLPCPALWAGQGRAGRPQGFYTIIECLPCTFKCAGKPKKSPPCSSGFPIMVGRGSDFLRQNWKYACLSAKISNIFCQFFGNLLVNYGRNPIFIHFGIFSDRKSNKNNFYEQNSADSR